MSSVSVNGSQIYDWKPFDAIKIFSGINSDFSGFLRSITISIKLAGEKYEKVLLEAKPIFGESDEEKAEELEWYQSNRVVCNHFKMKINEKESLWVERLKTGSVEPNANEMLERMLKKYQDFGELAKMVFQREFTIFKLQSDVSLADHVTNFNVLLAKGIKCKSILAEASSAGSQFQLSVENDDRFRDTTSAYLLNLRSNSRDFDLDDFIAELEIVEKRLDLAKINSPAISAYSTTTTPVTSIFARPDSSVPGPDTCECGPSKKGKFHNKNNCFRKNPVLLEEYRKSFTPNPEMKELRDLITSSIASQNNLITSLSTQVASLSTTTRVTGQSALASYHSESTVEIGEIDAYNAAGSPDSIPFSAMNEDSLYYIDSGCGQTICRDQTKFLSITPAKGVINTAGKGQLQIRGIGSIELWLELSGSKTRIVLNAVLFVPDASVNLLSVIQYSNIFRFTVEEKRCRIEVIKSNRLLLDVAGSKSNMFEIKSNPPIPPLSLKKVFALFTSAPSPVELMHRQSAHASVGVMKLIIEESPHLFPQVTAEALDEFRREKCSICLIAKAKNTKFPDPDYPMMSRPVSDVLEVVYADLAGPFEASRSGAFYMAVIVDHLTSKAWVKGLKRKSDFQDWFMSDWLPRVENESDKKVKIFITDNGGEFVSTVLSDFLKKRGIHKRFTVAGTPQQNGRAEVVNRILYQIIRCLLLDQKLPKIFWEDAMNYAVFIRNGLPSRLHGKKSAEELYSGMKVKIEKLHIFGSTCYIKDPNDPKLDARAKVGRYLGVASDNKSHLVTFPNDSKNYISRNVTFPGLSSIFTDDIVVEELDLEVDDDKSNSYEDSDDDDENYVPQKIVIEPLIAPVEDPAADAIVPPIVDAIEPEIVPGRVASRRQAGLPAEIVVAFSAINKYLSPDLYHKPRINRLSSLKIIPHLPKRISKINCYRSTAFSVPILDLEKKPPPILPITYKDTRSGPHVRNWDESMQQEYDQLVDNDVFEVMNLPKNGSRAIGVRWVYAFKFNQLGEIERFKSRLVAQGHTQKEGLDYIDPYAPVTQMDSVKLIFAIIAREKLEFRQADVVTAFLTAEIDGDVYVKIPEGFRKAEDVGKVWKLKRALYGLHQSPKLFYNHLKKIFTSIEFSHIDSDFCVFKGYRNGERLIIMVYVDDLIIAGKNARDIEEILLGIEKHVRLDRRNGELFLGLKITRNIEKGTIALSVPALIKNCLIDLNLQDCNAVDTPMDVNFDVNKWTGERINVLYRMYVGKLGWIVICRPDIQAAVAKLQRFAENPSPEQWQGVIRVFKYLKGTINHGLVFGLYPNAPIINSYSDSDWAGDQDSRKSVTGGLVYVFGSLVVSISKRQKNITKSSAEAEYGAVSTVASNVIWIRMILNQLDYTQLEPTPLYCDNNTAISMTQTGCQSIRVRHVDVALKYGREGHEDGILNITKVHTDRNPADVMTKPLGAEKFNKFRFDLGIRALNDSPPLRLVTIQ